MPPQSDTSKAKWVRCPWCEGSAFRTRQGFIDHIWHVHLYPSPKLLPVLGPVDVRCPYCGSRRLSVLASGWPAVTTLRCVCGGQWGQWI